MTTRIHIDNSHTGEWFDAERATERVDLGDDHHVYRTRLGSWVRYKPGKICQVISPADAARLIVLSGAAAPDALADELAKLEI